MRSMLTIDILRVTFLVPADLSEAETQAIARILGSQKFATKLSRLVRQILANEPRIKPVRVQISH